MYCLSATSPVAQPALTRHVISQCGRKLLCLLPSASSFDDSYLAIMLASLLLSQFLPLPAIKLRRFVNSVDEPHRDYHDLNDGSSFKVVKKVESHYDSIDSLADYRTFTSELASLLSASFSKRHKTSIRITTNQVKTYYLNNYGGLGMLSNRKTFGDGLSKLWMKGKISMSWLVTTR